MAARARANMAWLVQVESDYGTRMLRAHPQVVTDDGELRNPSWGWSEDGREFADLQVQAYLGDSDWRTNTSTGGKLWGLGHYFKPHRIDNAEHARSIATMFGRIERGLKKAEEEGGYVKDGDFLAYLTRIGAAIGIREYHVRNYGRQLEMSGERFRKVNVSTLQWWIADVQELAEKSPATLKG